MESPSFDAMKTQAKINLSGENNVSKRDSIGGGGGDADLTDTAPGSPVQQQQQQLNESSTVTATACS